ncbi:MAG: cobyric acid synthase [Thermosulfidibacteraceae bacterium]
MALRLMIQGTMSGVGKSFIVTALCRIFRRMGFRVAHFKFQNMSLNSYVTVEGLEIARSQAIQAMAAGVEPSYRMNPILLKPTGDERCQVVIRGKVFGYRDYYKPYSTDFLTGILEEDFGYLDRNFDIVVIEGVGSPAEINIKDRDFSNMFVAKMTNTPVIIVGDIFRGGVFASLFGTYMLLGESEKKLVKGFIINKFIGNSTILKRGIEELEKLTGIETLGVVPYTDFRIDEEDTISDVLEKGIGKGNVKVAILKLPHISNYTDIEPLYYIPDVEIRYVNPTLNLDKYDILIIPGTKNTIEDLLYLKRYKFDREIKRLRDMGKVIVGICGGFQMLGEIIEDPYNLESNFGKATGLGLLKVKTVMLKEKITSRVKAEIIGNIPFLQKLENRVIEGYEIHKGFSEIVGEESPFALVFERNSVSVTIPDGAVSKDGMVFGTYVHGIFENSKFLLGLVNFVRERKGLGPIDGIESYKRVREAMFDRLADLVENYCDIEKILAIMKRYS